MDRQIQRASKTDRVDTYNVYKITDNRYIYMYTYVDIQAYREAQKESI